MDMRYEKTGRATTTLGWGLEQCRYITERALARKSFITPHTPTSEMPAQFPG